MSRNPIVNLLRGSVTHTMLREGTKLGGNVIHKIMTDENARVRPQTAEIILAWVNGYFANTPAGGNFTMDNLFHENNLVENGRMPLSKTVNHSPNVTSMMVICGECFMEVVKRPICNYCDEPLKARATSIA